MPQEQEPHTANISDVSQSATGPQTGRHLLGPHVVGQRVVVRRLVPGETGPSGGPAMTDLLGVCRSWADGVCVVEPDDGPPVAIALGLIVSGKPVPPRPDVRHRTTPFEAQTRAAALFPGLETQTLGGWTLRHSSTHTARRANSVLAVRPAEAGADPVAEVERFYRERARSPIAAVLPGSSEERLFAECGWVAEDDRSGEADTRFEIAGVARCHRALRRMLAQRPTPAGEVALDVRDAVATATATSTTGADGEPVVGGVAVVDGDWVGVRSLDVHPDHRRQGWATAVLAELLEWGAERGATTAYLQVVGDNVAALALYEAVGFTTHHTYRYLVAPTRA